MNFEEFQNRARLYVIGALEGDELEETERRERGSDSKPTILSGNVTSCMRPSPSVSHRQNHRKR